MHAASVEAWWERVPQLAGPLATRWPPWSRMYASRSLSARWNAGAASRRDGDQIVFSGSVLIASGRARS